MGGEVDFYARRRCFREPIAEIFEAAELLGRAADAHVDGERAKAAGLIAATNLPAIRQWTESLWGSRAKNPDQWKYLRVRDVPGAPPRLGKAQCLPIRMPDAAGKQAIIARYGRNCMFCGIPLISEEVRNSLKRLYPEALPWGRTNLTQHAAFQCMWLQFDHVLPHSRGGDNSIENVIVTCAPCNYARWYWTLDEVGLIDPRTVAIVPTAWDGLERVLAKR